MTNINQIDINAKTTFEQSVYAEFPYCLHAYVEYGLFVSGVQLENGTMSMEEFAYAVLEFARWSDEQAEKHKADTAIFEGIKTLIGQEVFKDASLVAELTDELEQGETSMLARFIRFQSAENSFDAALSFIVWKRFKFLAELEKEFGISLDYFRTLSGADFLCAPKSNMFVTKF